jgi:hypothetical protein
MASLRDKKGRFLKGYHPSLKTEFQKGEHASIKTELGKGKNHPNYGKSLSLEIKRKIGKANKGRKFSEEMIKNFSEAHKGKVGEKASAWKGGITPIYQIIRTSKEYKIWREAIFKRDNYTCRACKKRGGILNAHHVLPFSKYPEKRFEMENGITLCIDCHGDNHPEINIPCN